MKKSKKIFLSIFLTFPFLMAMCNQIYTFIYWPGFLLLLLFTFFVLYNVWAKENQEKKKNRLKDFLFILCEIIVSLAWLSNAVVYLGFIFSNL